MEKEQQEKNKLKREIEDCLRAYYLALIEMKHPDNALRKDDGFDNCYNFVKDVIIAISQNVHLGRQILLCLTDRSSLSSLFV